MTVEKPFRNLGAPLMSIFHPGLDPGLDGVIRKKEDRVLTGRQP